MSWALVRTTKPNEPVISITDAKEHLRVVHDAEDILIQWIVDAATEHCETFQGRAYVTQEFQLTLPRFPHGRALRLPRPPLQGVEQIEYLDRNGDTQTLDSSAYRSVTTTEPGMVILNDGESWPQVGQAPDAVRVTFTAGYGGPEDVPHALQSAVLLYAGHLYENRETATVGTGPSFRLPLGYENLLRPNRFTMPDPLGAR